MERKTLLSIQNIEKRYDLGFSLNGISLDIEEGMIVGIIGLNGSGKSTLLSCITDSKKRDSGDVYFYNKSLMRENNKMYQDIGIVRSEQNYPEDFTPKLISNIMKNIYENWSQEYFYNVLSCLDVKPEEKICNFSTGMKSKLSIAMALSQGAHILILDEPTNGLDIIAREKVRECLFEFVQDSKKAIIITSHILGDIEKISDRIVVLDKGEIILDKSKDELLQNFAVYKITLEQLNNIDEKYIVKFKKREMYISLLVHNRYDFENENGIVDGLSGIEDIVELFLEAK